MVAQRIALLTLGSLALLGGALAARVTAAAPAVRPPAAAMTGAEIAHDVYLVPGKLVPGQQPDGNSVVFRGPQGAVIFDTGRHPEHAQAVLDLVAKLGLV